MAERKEITIVPESPIGGAALPMTRKQFTPPEPGKSPIEEAMTWQHQVRIFKNQKTGELAFINALGERVDPTEEQLEDLAVRMPQRFDRETSGTDAWTRWKLMNLITNPEAAATILREKYGKDRVFRTGEGVGNVAILGDDGKVRYVDPPGITSKKEFLLDIADLTTDTAIAAGSVAAAGPGGLLSQMGRAGAAGAGGELAKQAIGAMEAGPANFAPGQVAAVGGMSAIAPALGRGAMKAATGIGHGAETLGAAMIGLPSGNAAFPAREMLQTAAKIQPMAKEGRLPNAMQVVDLMRGKFAQMGKKHGILEIPLLEKAVDLNARKQINLGSLKSNLSSIRESVTGLEESARRDAEHLLDNIGAYLVRRDTNPMDIVIRGEAEKAATAFNKVNVEDAFVIKRKLDDLVDRLHGYDLKNNRRDIRKIVGMVKKANGSLRGELNRAIGTRFEQLNERSHKVLENLSEMRRLFGEANTGAERNLLNVLKGGNTGRLRHILTFDELNRTDFYLRARRAIAGGELGRGGSEFGIAGVRPPLTAEGKPRGMGLFATALGGAGGFYGAGPIGGAIGMAAGYGAAMPKTVVGLERGALALGRLAGSPGVKPIGRTFGIEALDDIGRLMANAEATDIPEESRRMAMSILQQKLKQLAPSDHRPVIRQDAKRKELEGQR